MSDRSDDDTPVGDAEEAKVVRVDFRARAAPVDPAASEKCAVFSRFAEQGKVMVTLDARRAGVAVPPSLAAEPQLNLDFSHRFGLADFAYDERGVRASLTFNRQPYFCEVPWSAVYSLFSHVDNERLTWARSLPPEILERLPEASVEHLERVRELHVERLLRAARVRQEQERAGPRAPPAGASEGGAEERPRGGLRLVKAEREPDTTE